jgi:DNA-binding NarL/FixJ family response regulator
VASHVRIVIIEDHRLLAQSLAALVSREPGFEFAGSAADGEEGWRLCLSTNPAFALVDIGLPKVDGLELSRRLLKIMPSIRILAMSAMVDPYTIWRVRESGVHGFIEKNQGALACMEAIRAVAAGGTFFSQACEGVKRNWLSQPEAFHKVLSVREQTILRCVASGSDDQLIASQLGISVSTVAVHRKHIRRKLELHNDRGMVRYARLWGLDQPLDLGPKGGTPVG